MITGLYIALSLRDITAVPAYEIMGIFYGISLMAIAPGVFYVLAGIFSGALQDYSAQNNINAETAFAFETNAF